MGVITRRRAGTGGLIILLDALAHHEPVNGATSVGIVGVRFVDGNNDDGVTGVGIQVSAVYQRL